MQPSSDSREVTGAEVFMERLGDLDGRALARALEERLVVSRPGGRIEIAIPGLLPLLERAIAHGLSAAAAIEAVAAVRRACQAGSGAILHAFSTDIWDPFDRAGRPDEHADDVAVRLLACKALAQDAFDAVLPAVLVELFDGSYDEVFGLGTAQR